MIITLKKDQVKALLACAAKNDIRFYLNGILIDNSGDNGCLCVATDNHMLLAGKPDKIEYSEYGKWIVPRNILELALKTKAKDFVIEVGTGMSGYINNLPFTCIDGQYPDLRKFVSDTDRVTTVPQFNPELISVAHNAAKLFSNLSKGGIILARVSKDGKQLYYHAENCFSLVAGLRSENLVNFPRILI